MPKFRVHVVNTFNYSVDVEASDDDEANNKAVEVLVNAENDNTLIKYDDGEDGLEVVDTEELD